MKLFYALVLMLGLWQVGRSADAPIPVPESVFPNVPLPPAPAPTPTVDPTSVPVLMEGVYYVIKSDAPFLLYASPSGLVTITKDAGPIRIGGKFIDGNGKNEQRTYKQKYLAFVEPVPGAKGRVELIYQLQGATDESKAVRRTLDVNTAPIPPPNPVDPPSPKPVDPPGPVTSFRVIWVHESGTTVPQSQVSVMDSKVVRDYLTANTTKDGTFPGFRRWDKDIDASNDFPVFKTMWETVKPKLTDIPCLVIEVNGKAEVCPFPKSPADAVALFKSKNGGK